MAEYAAPIQRGKLFLITLGHFCTDSYSNFLPALLPLVIVKLSLSLTLAGLLASVYSIASSLMQTVMGYIADRMRTRYLVIIGPLFATVFLCALGLAPDYLSLLALLILGGLGVSAFHPQTVTMAGEISGTQRGLGVSLFIAGGTAGYALSPLWVTALVSWYGMGVLPLAAIPGLGIVVLLICTLPLAGDPHQPQVPIRLRQAFRGRMRPMLMLMMTVIIRSFTRLGTLAFLPILLQSRGLSLVAGGMALTVFSFMGSVGGLVGGYLSDRVGRRRIILYSMLGSAPFLYAALQVDGLLFFGLLGLAGLMLNSADSVVVATAQELVPDRAGMASSMVMGLGWGLGGVAVTGIGWIADSMGVTTALNGLALLPLAGLVFCLGIPESRRTVDREGSAGDTDTHKNLKEREPSVV